MSKLTKADDWGINRNMRPLDWPIEEVEEVEYE